MKSSPIIRPPDRIFHYGPPEASEYFEPLIRPICERINQSGWLWTVESCEGHGPENPSSGWGGPRPMIRFGCRTKHIGHVILLLDRARVDECGLHRFCVSLFPGYASNEAWSDLLTYIDDDPQSAMQTVNERRAVYRTLAELAHTYPPQSGEVLC